MPSTVDQRHRTSDSMGIESAESYRGVPPTTDVYVDGSSMSSNKDNASAGFGVHFPGSSEKDISGPLPLRELHTSQNAELYAVRKALKATRKATGPVEIRTDSNNVIEILTVKPPTSKASKGVPAANADRNLTMGIKAAAAARKHPVVLSHVRSHSGDFGNAHANRLAREGASARR